MERSAINMHAEVIAIGDELTSGQRLDTNSQWLSQRLGEIGIRVLYHATAGDDLEACTRVFKTACQRSPLVIATGGLGPTADDLTRDAIARCVGVDLVLHENVLTHIESLFSSRGREMPDRNRLQAMFPKGSDVIPNPHGTAPGIDIAVEGTIPSRIFALPGVPAEMKQMWDESLRPAISSMTSSPNRVITHRRIKCFGVGESTCENMLPNLIRRGRSPSVGITVHRATITLRITAESHSVSHNQQQIAETEAIIRAKLGNLVFGEEDEELEHVLTKLLTDRDESVAIAEWGTAGIASHWMGSLGMSSAFRGGAVVQSAKNVEAILGIDRTVAAACRSEQLARDMAIAVRDQFHADYGLAISAFPQIDEPNEQYHFALATHGETFCKSHLFAAHPDILRDLAAKQLLNLLRVHLL